MTVEHLDPIYDIEECAEYLECSQDWLRAQLRSRRFPGMKIAGRWRMRESHLQEALDTMTFTARAGYTPSPSGLSRNSRFRRRLAS